MSRPSSRLHCLGTIARPNGRSSGCFGSARFGGIALRLWQTTPQSKRLLQGRCVSLDDLVFRQNRQLITGQSQLAAKYLHVMFADQRRPPGEPPGRITEYRCLAWVDEATSEFRVLHLLPEATILQMKVIKQV